MSLIIGGGWSLPFSAANTTQKHLIDHDDGPFGRISVIYLFFSPKRQLDVTQSDTFMTLASVIIWLQHLVWLFSCIYLMYSQIIWAQHANQQTQHPSTHIPTKCPVCIYFAPLLAATKFRERERESIKANTQEWELACIVPWIIAERERESDKVLVQPPT